MLDYKNFNKSQLERALLIHRIPRGQQRIRQYIEQLKANGITPAKVAAALWPPGNSGAPALAGATDSKGNDQQERDDSTSAPAEAITAGPAPQRIITFDPVAGKLNVADEQYAAWQRANPEIPIPLLVERAERLLLADRRHDYHALLSELIKDARQPLPATRGQSPLIALELDELFARDFTPMESLLAPWLRRQNLVMVHAARGVGKTHFALGIAYAVATATAFLGWKAEKAWRVLYIDGEMPGMAMKERLQAIRRSVGVHPQPGFLKIITPDAHRDNLPDLGQAFDDLARDADLIVVDNLSCLTRSAGPENEGESWLPVLDWALAQRRAGKAVLFLHHSGKSGGQRGASRKEDQLDVVLRLRHPSDYSPEHGARFEIAFEKSRGLYGADVRPIEAKLTHDGADGSQIWTFGKAEDARNSRIIELYKLGGMSMTDIAAELGMNKSNVSRALTKARAAGLLPKEGRPRG